MKTLTQREAWQRLGVSRATYYRMIDAGRIHPIHINPRKIVVRRAEIENLLEGK